MLDTALAITVLLMSLSAKVYPLINGSSGSHFFAREKSHLFLLNSFTFMQNDLECIVHK